MTKSFSEGFKVSRKDIIEFNQWIKSGDITPRLRSHFKSDSEYEDYMTEYQESHKDKIFSGVSEGAAVINSGMSYGGDQESSENEKSMTFASRYSWYKKGDIYMAYRRGWGLLFQDGKYKGWDGHFDPGEPKLRGYERCSNPGIDIESVTPKDKLDKFNYWTTPRSFSESREKVSAELLEKAKNEGVVQKKPNGSWGIISIDAGEWWDADYDSKESAEDALKAYHANKSFSEKLIEKQPRTPNDKKFIVRYKVTIDGKVSSRWTTIWARTERGAFEVVNYQLNERMIEGKIEDYMIESAKKYQKSFSSSIYYSYDGKHEFTIEELKDMQKLLTSNKDTFDLIMLWMNHKVTSDELLNKGVNRGYADDKPSIKWAIESQMRKDNLEEIGEKVSEELSGILKKLGLKFDHIEARRFSKGEISFYIHYKDKKSLDNDVEFLNSNLESFGGPKRLKSIRRYDEKYDIQFYSWEDESEFIIYATIDSTKLKSNNLLRRYTKEDSGSFFSNTVSKFRYNMNTRSFSLIPLKNGSFDPMPTEMLPDDIPGVPDLIGSLMFSITYAHLYHICTSEYPAHVALQEYYEKMPDLVDALAEAVIGDNNELEFRCIVYPKESESAIDYFNSLLELVLSVQEITSQADQMYQPQVDAIKEQVESTLYKLKRLSGGQKVFSEVK